MIEIHTLSWSGDVAIRDGEDRKPQASLMLRVWIDGVEIPGVMRSRVTHRVDNFADVVLAISDVTTVVNHTRESWDALPKVNS